MKKLLCTFITLSCITQTALGMDSESELENLYSKKHTVKKAMEATGTTEEVCEEEKKSLHKKYCCLIY